MFYFIFFLLLFLCCSATVGTNVVCLPTSYLSAFENGRQPVAVDNVVTDPPTETNQVKSDNPDDTKAEVADNAVDESTTENTNNPIGSEFCLLLAHH